MKIAAARERATGFCNRYSLRLPILEAPMAGANSVDRAAAVADAGGMGAMGALLTPPEQIAEWVRAFRERSHGALQVNLWIPDPAPRRDPAHEFQLRTFLSQWGPIVPENVDEHGLPDFPGQCRALVEAKPAVASSIMGLFPPEVVRALKANGIAWFATATTLAEARAAEAAGADAIIAQGFEAGGHRGAFDSAKAEQQAIGLFALLPRLAEHIQIPLIAAGGIADGRGISAALTLGASAVQIGTALLPTVESSTPRAWADALRETEPESTRPTRAFSGRLGRAILTPYVRAAHSPDAPRPAPYPLQRNLTAGMREAALKANDLARMQAWAGQSAWMASHESAGMFVARIWQEAQALLP